MVNHYLGVLASYSPDFLIVMMLLETCFLS